MRAPYRLLVAAAVLVPLVLIAAAFMFVVAMPGRSYRGPLEPLTPDETVLRDRLRSHVEALAADIGERNLWRYDALNASAQYIDNAFAALGYPVQSQEFAARGESVRNIEVALPGTSDRRQTVVVGAHYDTVRGSPGANDNGSGLAALLELARLLKGRRLPRTIRLVAFVNEEAPFAYTAEMGSRVYARRARSRDEDIVAMLSLETIGYYSDVPGSQHYPFPFSLFYPDTGNFIGFVGNSPSRNLVRGAIASFRQHVRFPSEGIAAPEWVTGVGWSDHWSFWREGYPALMVTDTAPFRYPYYHVPADTPDKIDYGRLARVVTGLAGVVSDLAGVP
jgi:Zn-dependent M28 family amino/carboxypeptidase